MLRWFPTIVRIYVFVNILVFLGIKHMAVSFFRNQFSYLKIIWMLMLESILDLEFVLLLLKIILVESI